MALWGNNDNVGSGGTVTLDYSTRIVTGFNGVGGAAGEAGSGTTFGQTGFAKTGDTISFGEHGTSTYFGEAIIAAIGGTTQVTIASTVGLNGSEITGQSYTISEQPTWIPGDSQFNHRSSLDPSINIVESGSAEFASGIGSHSIAIDISSIPDVQIGDYLVNGTAGDGTENLKITAIGLCTAPALATVSPGDFGIRAILPDFLVSGETTVGLGTTQPTIAGAGETTATTSGSVSSATVVPLTNGDKYNPLVGDVVKLPGIADKSVAAVGSNQVTLNASVSLSSGVAVTFVSDTIGIIDTPAAADLTIGVGETITFQGEGGVPGDVLNLDEGISVALSIGTGITFKRTQAGYDNYVYGVNQSGIATGTQYEVGVGWVGVQTYMDNQNNLRVKKEILVAMSGITTGNQDAYPPE